MPGPGSTAMESTLSELDHILDRLAKPEALEAEDLLALARAWDEAAARLDGLADAGPEADPVKRDLNRARLKRIIQRLPEIQKTLGAHKSDVARQLFSENRRFQTLRSGYGAAVGQAKRKFNQRA